MSGQTMRILIVEDEQALREGLTDLIRNDGHQVEAVGDGAEAVQIGMLFVHEDMAGKSGSLAGPAQLR